jgi:hypothetical protein
MQDLFRRKANFFANPVLAHLPAEIRPIGLHLHGNDEISVICIAVLF